MRKLVIKPAQTELKYTWGLAVWTPVFTQYLHDFITTRQETTKGSQKFFVGDVIQAGLDKGMNVQVVHISDQPYIDIGTPEDLSRAVKIFTSC